MSISENLSQVRERMAAACERAGREPGEVTLIAVSKTKPVSMLMEAYDAGTRVFGENKVPGLLKLAASSLSFSVEMGPVDISRVVDASKVSDHHALLPTMQAKKDTLAALPAGERNILTLVMVRLLCAVSEKLVYEDTAAVLDCSGTSFTAKGRVVITTGWKAVEQAFQKTLKQKAEKGDPEPAALPPLAEGQTFSDCKATVREGATAPPKHFTEDLLLSAMEHASAEEFAEIDGVERTGLGTPATRAGVIEKLVRGGFLERKGRQLLPTKKGHNLIVVLPEGIKSAKLTAEWEAALKEVEHGERSPEGFLSGIERMTADLVEGYRAIQADISLFDQREPIGKCPRCGKDVVESKLSFQCIDRSCGFTMWKNSRFFTDKHKELTKTVASAHVFSTRHVIFMAAFLSLGEQLLRVNAVFHQLPDGTDHSRLVFFIGYAKPFVPGFQNLYGCFLFPDALVDNRRKQVLGLDVTVLYVL